MTASFHMTSRIRGLLSRVTLVSLSLGILQPSLLPGTFVDRSPRQTRLGSLRSAGGGSQRGSARDVEAHVPEFPLGASSLAAATSAAPRRTAAGALLATAGDRPHAGLAPRSRTDALPPELWSLAPRSRPQAPTFGRPPPLQSPPRTRQFLSNAV